LLLTGLAIIPAFSQQSWQRTYGGGNDDWGSSVQQTSDGGFIAGGWTSFYGSARGKVYLFKTNATGDTLWSHTYGRGINDYGNSIQQTSDGGYIVAGSTYYSPTTAYDVYLVKTNSSGDTLWTRTYGGRSDDYGYSVQQTSDGGYIVAGTTYSFGAGGYDIYLIKTDASGDTLWTRTYGGANDDEGYSVQQTLDSGYIVAGYTISFGAGSADVYFIKTDASGDTLWTRTYGGTKWDEGLSAQQTSDGGYITTGWTFSFDDTLGNVYLIKTDAAGDTLWTRTYGGTGLDHGYSVQQTSDGGYIVAGGTYSYGAGNNDVYLIKTDASGDTLWTRTYGGTEHDESYSVRQTSDRGYILAGLTYSFGAGGSDVFLIKTDANGNVGIENNQGDKGTRGHGDTVIPNPFTSFTRILGHEADRFAVYDISGRRVGTYPGNRIGPGLSAGIYFLRPENGSSKTQRIVKLR
jgi:hypothetical protein